MKKIFTLLVIVPALSAAITVRAEAVTLKTQTGIDIGWSFSAYQYQEPGIMSSRGDKMGLDLRATKVLQNEQFIRGDLRYAVGTVDYTSNRTGSSSGETDWYIEARVLTGKDLAIKEAVLTPYLGLGYRYLFNDGRGISSTGNWGYRRESNYLYLPFGIIHRRMLIDQARLVSTLEFDSFLAGKQISRLSDGGQGYSDATNSQSSGYGLKWSVVYEKKNWAVGPYGHYWNIGQSDIVPEIRNGIYTGRGLVEPKNNTIEFGLKVGRLF